MLIFTYDDYKETKRDGLIAAIKDERVIDADILKEINYENSDIKPFVTVYEDAGERDRWSIGVQVILKIDDEYYSFYYSEGLTEHQESEYEDQQLVKVKPVERTVIDWVEIE